MKLFHSHSSPFVRKVMVVAHELGLAERLELLPSAVHPVKRDRSVLAQHPLAQVPTLVLPDGSVMSESAAITLLLADITGKDSLVPGPRAPERGKFLRWLVFLVANIYPTFTYADDPARFVSVSAARDPFRAATDAYAQRLWRQVESEAGGPWFLGDRFSALDLYIDVMTRWRPRRGWFEVETPRLYAIARQADALPELAGVWKRNFPTD